MKASFAGTFDPVTTGHLDLIERAAALFDGVVVIVSPNSEKKTLFDEGTRKEFLSRSVSHLPNVEVCVEGGLATAAAKKHGCAVLVRGVRNGLDLDYETNMQEMNRRIAPDLETVLLATRPELAHTSSSNVRELLKYGCSIKGMVPDPVLTMVEEAYETRNIV